MTIFNQLCMPSNIELHMISFLPHEDQVTVSGVNTKAYKILSNDGYFYKLFLMKYCSFETGEKYLEKHLEILHNRHPSNCWKVACCFFQASRMNFSQAFFNEEIPHLEKEKSGYESRIKKICGNSYADPSSLIHQAWIAYQDQKGKCNYLDWVVATYQPLFIQIVTDTGRADEWNAIWLKLDPMSSSEEEQLAAVEKFDKRLVSLVLFDQNLHKAKKIEDDLRVEYMGLERERNLRVDSIEEINQRLKIINSHDPSTFPFLKRVLLRSSLSGHLENLSASPQATSEDIYHTLKAWANIELPGRILLACVRQKVDNPQILPKLKLLSAIIVSDAIEECAARDVEDLQKNFSTYIDEICNFFANLPKEHITQELLKAIERKHGVRLNLNQN